MLTTGSASFYHDIHKAALKCYKKRMDVLAASRKGLQARKQSAQVQHLMATKYKSSVHRPVQPGARYAVAFGGTVHGHFLDKNEMPHFYVIGKMPKNIEIMEPEELNDFCIAIGEHKWMTNVHNAGNGKGSAAVYIRPLQNQSMEDQHKKRRITFADPLQDQDQR